MKVKLRLPLRSTIQDGFDERDVTRLWRALRARRPRRRAVWWLATAVAAASAVALVWAVPRLTLGQRPGPLRLASGAVPTILVAEHEPQRLALADGSAILAASHSKVDILANDAKLFLAAVRQGSARIQVQPGGPRRWVVECGPVSVEVVGTEFEIQRSAGQVLVGVFRGIVVVRGARVPDHVQRLSAGARLVIPTDDAPASVSSVVSAASSPPSPTASAQPAAAPDSAPRGRSAHRRIANAPAHTSGEDLIRRADVARRSGDFVSAKHLLGQAIDAEPGTPAGAVAALTLARLTMNDDPAAAAAVLARALGNAMPSGLEEDARARLVEACVRSGERASARQAAAEYRRRFPDGAHSQEVERWVAE